MLQVCVHIYMSFIIYNKAYLQYTTLTTLYVIRRKNSFSRSFNLYLELNGEVIFLTSFGIRLSLRWYTDCFVLTDLYEIFLRYVLVVGVHV